MLDNIISIGDTLKEIREDKGLQLQDVAESTAINYSSLSRIENGKRLPTKEQLTVLAKFYEYDGTDLLKILISDRILAEIKDEEEIGLEAFYLTGRRIMFSRTRFPGYKTIKKFSLISRRYLGSNLRSSYWIIKVIQNETSGTDTFIDLFAGTGIMAQQAMIYYDKVIVNDFLHSNNIIYHAFFDAQEWNLKKLVEIAYEYNKLAADQIDENYFSKNFGGKFFEEGVSKIIGYIREDIENRREELNQKEYGILLTSLIFTIDKLANTVGHFDSYLKKPIPKRPLNFGLIKPHDFEGVQIYQEDANKLAGRIKGDVAYIDPPYNSRQYSRFYHIYENLVKWEKPELFGVALKPAPENMSKYSTAKAKAAFKKLVHDLDVKYLAVFYNNTSKSSSSSSANKIEFNEMKDVLNSVGKTKIFEETQTKPMKTGAEFKEGKRYLFITEK